MSTDIVDRPRSSLIGTAFAGLALLARPGLLLAWTLVAAPAFLAAIAAVRIGTGFQTPATVFVLPLSAIAVRLTQSMLSAAAYRARLRPEQGRFAHLGFGAAEWRIFAMGFGRNPAGIPLTAFVGLAGLFIALVLAVALVNALFGGPAGVVAIGLAFLTWFAAVMIVNARAGLAGVAAFSGRASPQEAGWELGAGRTGVLAAVGLVISLLALTTAAGLLGGWWVADSLLARPSALWAYGLPADGAGWTRLALEGVSLALVLGLAQALFTAFGETAHAELWERFGGEREAAPRRSLFEV